MLPWKRRELYMGRDKAEAQRVREVLDANGIVYDYRAPARTSSERSARLSLFSQPYFLYIYVRPEDFEQAMFLAYRQ